MHVDWEIAASLSNFARHARSGLIGILLPDCVMDVRGYHDPYTMPPRLSENVEFGYAKIHWWSSDTDEVRAWVEDAFVRRKRVEPHNGLPLYHRNLKGRRWMWDYDDLTGRRYGIHTE